MTDDRTRPPRAPPFPIGTVLRYDGDRRVYHDDGMKEPILQPGLIVRVVDVRPGRQGTGRILFRDDDGDEVYDETEDGASVYQTSRGFYRLIRAAEDHGTYQFDRWVVVVPAPTQAKPRAVGRGSSRRSRRSKSPRRR
jgi:hypothetical protein